MARQVASMSRKCAHCSLRFMIHAVIIMGVLAVFSPLLLMATRVPCVLGNSNGLWVSQNSVPQTCVLGAVWGTSSHDVFAVGDTIILHYNGSAWTTMTTGTNYSLRSAWGSSSSDVFVVGYGDYSGNGGYGAIILHYNGSAWTTMTSGTTNPLYGVWGSSATKVFAVGDGGTILRFDGEIGRAHV